MHRSVKKGFIKRRKLHERVVPEAPAQLITVFSIREVGKPNQCTDDTIQKRSSSSEADPKPNVRCVSRLYELWLHGRCQASANPNVSVNNATLRNIDNPQNEPTCTERKIVFTSPAIAC